jgi:hypothetical protein
MKVRPLRVTNLLTIAPPNPGIICVFGFEIGGRHDSDYYFRSRCNYRADDIYDQSNLGRDHLHY